MEMYGRIEIYKGKLLGTTYTMAVKQLGFLFQREAIAQDWYWKKHFLQNRQWFK